MENRKSYPRAVNVMKEGEKELWVRPDFDFYYTQEMREDAWDRYFSGERVKMVVCSDKEGRITGPIEIDVLDGSKPNNSIDFYESYLDRNFNTALWKLVRPKIKTNFGRVVIYGTGGDLDGIDFKNLYSNFNLKGDNMTNK